MRDVPISLSLSFKAGMAKLFFQGPNFKIDFHQWPYYLTMFSHNIFLQGMKNFDSFFFIGHIERKYGHTLIFQSNIYFI